MAIPVAAAVAIVALLAKQKWVAIAATAVALFAGPASYSVANVGHALNGNNVLAGPSGVGGAAASAAARAAGAAGGGAAAERPGSRRAAVRRRRAAVAASAAARRSPPTCSSYLEAHQGSAKYLVAATGSQTTAPIIIQTGKAVVTIGGFSGQDNSPTVAQLEQMVESGELKYIVSSGNGTLDAWVQEHGTAVDGYDGLYELTAT